MSVTFDDAFLDLSSKLTEPFTWAHGQYFRVIQPLDPARFDNHDTFAKEIAHRALIVSGSLIGTFLAYSFPLLVIGGVVGLALASKVTRAIGFWFQKDNYTHIRTATAEKILDTSAKILTWNICGPCAMAKDHGGVNHWQDRIDRIVATIKNEDPDVLLLEEIYDTALAEAIIAKLGSHYAHFYTHLGQNVIGSVGGCMVAFKGHPEKFTNINFNNNDASLTRTFATLEFKIGNEPVRFIGTHLIHNSADSRTEQVAQIERTINDKMLTILAGDLNVERDQSEGEVLSHFEHGYKGSEPTCTNRMIDQWSSDWDPKNAGTPGEVIDYISIYKPSMSPKFKLEDVQLVRAFDDTYNTKEALSDHHGIVGLFKKQP